MLELWKNLLNLWLLSVLTNSQKHWPQWRQRSGSSNQVLLEEFIIVMHSFWSRMLWFGQNLIVDHNYTLLSLFSFFSFFLLTNSIGATLMMDRTISSTVFASFEVRMPTIQSLDSMNYGRVGWIGLFSSFVSITLPFHRWWKWRIGWVGALWS